MGGLSVCVCVCVCVCVSSVCGVRATETQTYTHERVVGTVYLYAYWKKMCTLYTLWMGSN